MKSYWENNTINIGKVTENTTKKFYFQALEDLPGIRNIIPACGCSDYKFNRETNRLHIIYTAGRLPYHLKEHGEQEIEKSFKIEYTGGGSDVLIFTGKKVKG